MMARLRAGVKAGCDACASGAVCGLFMMVWIRRPWACHCRPPAADPPATVVPRMRPACLPIMTRSVTSQPLALVTASTTPPASYRALAAADMALVDEVIHQRLASQVALVNQISHYIVSAGGKRDRPMLLLLVAGALGKDTPHRHELAAVVEFIHTATLLHDDVVDESDLRRGRKTANALFGNAASVLVGDFLYSRAFQMMVSTNRLRVMEVLAEATNVIAEGEVLQLMNMHDPDISVDDYLRVIEYKTAKLFEASARLGAVISDAPAEIEEACASYGRAIGTAFQLIDDLLDYEGSTAELGKNIGDDLREGKPTLPLLVAMQRGTPEQSALIREAIVHGEVERMPQIIEIVKATGALQATREAAEAQADVAKRCLDALPASQWREAMLELLSDSIKRSS